MQSFRWGQHLLTFDCRRTQQDAAAFITSESLHTPLGKTHLNKMNSKNLTGPGVLCLPEQCCLALPGGGWRQGATPPGYPSLGHC